MKTETRDRLGRVALAALGVLAMVALAVPAAEARVRIRSLGAKPSVSKPHVSVLAPSVPRPPVATPTTPGAPVAANAVASAGSRMAAAPPAVDNRGTFRRFWDWLLGRKPPTPAPARAPAQQAPAAAPAPRAVASGQTAAPPAPSVPAVVPVATGRSAARGASPTRQAAAGPQDQDKQRQASAAGAGAAGDVSLAAALEQSFGKQAQAPTGRRNGGGPAAAAARPDQRPVPSDGFILHLTNGQRIPVSNYRESGDQVVIEQQAGSFGLPKSIIARIEPRGAGSSEAISPGVNVQ